MVKTAKSFSDACAKLRCAVVTNGFGVIAEHDLGEILRSKGVGFAENCCVFEVCNPRQAAMVMGRDMSLSVVLPCRISVYTDAGQTWMSMVRPSEMLRSLSSDPELLDVAQQVDDSILAMMNDATAGTKPVSHCANQDTVS